MDARAYILIRTQPGVTEPILRALRRAPMVKSIEMITGPYDLIALLEAQTTNEILTAVRRDIRPAAGVWDTITCLVVPTEDESSGE